MAIARPVSDPQRRVAELGRLAKGAKEPICLTKNGSEHLVIIDSAEFSEPKRRAERALT